MATFNCPICSAPAVGNLDQHRWHCTESKYHYFAHRVRIIRAAKANWKPDPYSAEVLKAFASDEARASFLNAHALTHPADA